MTMDNQSEPFNYPAPMMQQFLKNKFDIEKLKAYNHAVDKSSLVKLS